MPWATINTTSDGETKQIHLQGEDYGEDFSLIGDYGVRLGLNNRVFFQDSQTDSQEFAYRPNLLGGSISYELQMKDIYCN